MVKFKHGDIFETEEDTVIVNPVNTVGVMGRGLALQFKKRFPHSFSVYSNCCRNGSLVIGKLLLTRENNRQILMFPTKEHWRDSSRIEYVEAGLQKFVATYQVKGIRKIAFPRLGCGCGGLDWNTVRALMVSYLSALDCEITIYE